MTLAAAAPDDILEALATWAQCHAGPHARVEGIKDLGGHSGETYGLSLLNKDCSKELVARFAPASGESGDELLFRQASLLAGLKDSGVKVAAVHDVVRGDAHGRSACLIVERLDGQPLIMGPEGQPSWLPEQQRQQAHELAVAELASLHRECVAEKLSGWDAPRSPREEIDLWIRAFERSAEEAWSVEGAALRDALLKRLPDNWTMGLCHGDFQTNNVMYACDGAELRVSGIIDWELAHVGSVEHDLAWFLMMNDSLAWDPVEQRGGLDEVAILDCYRRSGGRDLGDLSWFQALACYRIAAIAGYQIRLHRTGRKIDFAWERATSSMPRFFARARMLLGLA